MKHKGEISARIESRFRAVKELRSRFGTAKTLQHVVFRLVNRFFNFDCLHIIALKRENLKPLEPAKTHRLSARAATLEDLKEMERQGCWQLPPKTFEYFDRGDTCLLSCIDGKLAGYTWVLADGYPAILEGLRLSIPAGYLYNFCGFTLPACRGHGLQSFRHHALLNHPRWRDKKGLLGFVVHTNRSSKRGQNKSGYERIGKIYIIGRKSNVHALIEKNLRSMGIERVPSSPPEKTKQECL